MELCEATIDFLNRHQVKREMEARPDGIIFSKLKYTRISVDRRGDRICQEIVRAMLANSVDRWIICGSTVITMDELERILEEGILNNKNRVKGMPLFSGYQLTTSVNLCYPYIT